MSWFGYGYTFFILISGIYTATVFYKGRFQYILGEFISTFLAIWVVLAYYEAVDLPLEVFVFILIAGFVVYWEGFVNLPLIKSVLKLSGEMNIKGVLITSLISVFPFFYFVFDILHRYF